MPPRTQKPAEIYEDAELAHELEDMDALEEADEEFKLASAAEFNRGNFSQPLIRDASDPTRLVTIYVAETGEPRPVPRWTLDGKNSILRRRDPDGKRTFSVRKPPNAVWKLGETKCLLHPQHPRRAELDSMGLVGKVCDPFTGKHAEHLASEFAMRRHMQTKHRQEWDTINAAESETRDREQREFQRLQMALARKSLGIGET